MTESVPVKYVACLIALPLSSVQSVIPFLSVIKKKPCPMKKKISMYAPEFLYLGLAIPSFRPHLARTESDIAKSRYKTSITDACSGLSHTIFSFTPVSRSSFRPPIDKLLFSKKGVNLTPGIVVLNDRRLGIGKIHLQFPSPYGDYGSKRRRKTSIHRNVWGDSVPLRGLWF